MNSEVRICQNCKNQFTIEPDDFTFYTKMGVPAPHECPQCRQKHRILFRNFKTLYKRPSDKSGTSLISMYPRKVSFPVWSKEEWWADDWDPRDYGRDINFSRPFFEQLAELWKVVPRAAVLHVQTENCTYSNAIFNSKNCYLVFGGVDGEDCMYGHITWNSKQCADTLYVFKSEFCYECIDVLGSYRVLYSQECEDCVESVGLFDCRGCSNCIGCVGLRQKSYYVFNEPVGKEGYERFVKEHPLHNPTTLKMIREKCEELRKELPERYLYGSHNTNVSGNHIYHAKNVHYSFDVKSGEDSKYIFTCRKAVDSYDVAFTSDVELGYYVLTMGGAARNIMFSHYCVGSSDVLYSDNCFNCREVFGCMGLRKAEYCILNKQYSKEDYSNLKKRIIEHMKTTGEWGKFFPRSMSTFAYNESIINEYYPLAKEEVIREGYRWEDDIPRTAGQETVAHEVLPQDPKDFSSAILKEIMRCERCGYNYRFIQGELNLYKVLGLSLPRECFNCRHERRMSARNPRMLWPGVCAKCGTSFETSHPPEKQRSQKIYCESCYNSEVV